MKTLDLCAMAGLAPSTLQDWIAKGLVTPIDEGGKGRGNSREFSTMESVGIIVAAQIRSSERGCVLGYVAKVIAAFASMSEKELQQKLAKDGTHFVMEHYGKPILQGPVVPAFTTWPDVKAIYEQVLAAR